MNHTKVDVFLTGEGFSVKKLEKLLSPLSYNIDIVQEFNTPINRGPNRNKIATYGMCWLRRVPINKLRDMKSLFKRVKISEIIIDIHEDQIKTQTCLYLDMEIISCANHLKADIEIVDF